MCYIKANNNSHFSDFFGAFHGGESMSFASLVVICAVDFVNISKLIGKFHLINTSI